MFEINTSDPLPVDEFYEPDKGDQSQVSVMSLTKGRGYVVTPSSHRPPDGVDVDSMSLLELLECEYVPIGLPYGAHKFPVKTPDEAVEKLKELRSIGYQITEKYINKIRQI